MQVNYLLPEDDRELPEEDAPDDLDPPELEPTDEPEELLGRLYEGAGLLDLLKEDELLLLCLLYIGAGLLLVWLLFPLDPRLCLSTGAAELLL